MSRYTDKGVTGETTPKQETIKMKKCYICKDIKTYESFYRDASHKSGYSSRCKACDRKKTRLDFHKRDNERQEYIDRHRAVPCMDCENTYPVVCMDFDHRPGVEKLFPISDAVRYSFLQLIDEMAKCDVVCANCHRIRTQSRLDDRRLDGTKDPVD